MSPAASVHQSPLLSLATVGRDQFRKSIQMIDAVKEVQSVSLEEVRAIVATTFSCQTKVYADSEGHPIIRLKYFRRGVGCVAEFASDVMRQLAGQCLAAADELDRAAGKGPELLLEEIPDNRRFFRVTGFEDVDIVVHNCGTSEEAATVARQAIASLTASRSDREAAAHC